ncbi:hypothetical protein RO3G_07452 [Rhizopus delemar RA 99-880]|uniref:Uncharacterized protein n=1 Tax=Rhizopus delemar (strain RA 99-880 / ATCC MYA-4621 / FGSC 9543 / NRRL 43880) TaxID=246409 RepID=I1C2R7_RHIO9|nr:hypothetical protein RO3G_07452 [Rhizopus delemar RA 99-880]|eukprot:EIE82747.1 hypothetical protein RO3G_07452 [Rhizopus delemar RA 99-880]
MSSTIIPLKTNLLKKTWPAPSSSASSSSSGGFADRNSCSQCIVHLDAVFNKGCKRSKSMVMMKNYLEKVAVEKKTIINDKKCLLFS